MQQRTAILDTAGAADDLAAPDIPDDTLTDLLGRVSRTFALSNRYLPQPLRRAMTVSYLLFRVSDYLEDNHVMSPGRKIELLHLWERVLSGRGGEERLRWELRDLEDDDPEAEVARRFPELTQSLARLGETADNAVRQRVCETTRGMARRLAQGPVVETEAELDQYMHDVAGIVGYLITEIFSHFDRRLARRRDAMMGRAREYGLGLQTVNVIRGLRKDYARGWLFVPRRYLEEIGLSPRQFLSPLYVERSLVVVRRLAEKAEYHLRDGLEYVLQIPRHLHRVRLATMWPLLFAARTLALCRDNRDALLSEAKMSREDVERIVRRTMLHGWSNRWLVRYHEQLLRGEGV
ncbi:MAG: squalene/phytoene synthase family protein [Spirochaetes bacterium]|nr:squalene/phytoene synthase family protein [Spirochaetota bacterium]